jgi:hypothetical protein
MFQSDGSAFIAAPRFASGTSRGTNQRLSEGAVVRFGDSFAIWNIDGVPNGG